MPEPGWPTPHQGPRERCLDIMCPVDYCSANIDQFCMNPQGRFTKKAHTARVAKHDRLTRLGPEKGWGPGEWSRRPEKWLFEGGDGQDGEFYHNLRHGNG